MSIVGIVSNNLLQANPQTSINARQQFQQELRQLGQDLQSGSLSAAQSDFSALRQNSPAAASASGTPVAQAFSQLGKDLQSGNLTAARQDFTSLRQDLQSQGTQAHHHHHHHGGGAGAGEQTNLAQEFAQLGQDLQSGNISAAQQAYSSLQQSFQAFPPNGASAPVQVTA